MPRKPQPDLATYGLEDVQIFDYYPTRELYKAKTGMDAPPFDDSARAKYWFDPAAASANPDKALTYSVPFNSRGGIFTENGKPVPGDLQMMPYEAARVNIPQKGVGVFPGSASGIEVQAPIQLFPNEQLEAQPGIAGNQLRVRRLDKLTSGAAGIPTGGGFTEVDRATLQAIQRDVRLIKSQFPGIA